MEKEGNTVGEILRKTREQKGLSIQQVNQATKMSPQVISALEEDDHGSFPGETYHKGFLRSYAQYLGLDAGRLWAMSKGRQSDAADGSGGTFWDIEETIREEKLRSPRIFRRIVLPLLVLVIVVLALLLVRQTQKVKSLTTGATASPAAHSRTVG